MNISSNDLVMLITQAGIIIGAIGAAYKLIDRHLLKRFARLEERMEAQEKWAKKQQEDILVGAEADRLIIEGVLACLKGLKEQGCNGPVTEKIQKIEEYLITRASCTRSQ